ncbi:MAG: hypothetical protein ABI700_15540 [Chloroflexota bacterium]
MSEVKKIDSEVPFGHTVYTCLYLNDWHINQLIRHDQMEKTYLAWETVRKESNPYFEEGTGFEGYFVGRCILPDLALDEILAISQHMLDAIARLYRFEFGFRSRLMKTLTRESSDSRAIHIWSGYFGAELGRLRAQLNYNREAQQFQTQTYRIISMLPPIAYHEIDHDVTQSYALGSLPTPKLAKLSITLQMLKPSQQDAWLVANNIGVFGHPLVRKLLDRA